MKRMNNNMMRGANGGGVKLLYGGFIRGCLPGRSGGRFGGVWCFYQGYLPGMEGGVVELV